jgi:lysophospholipase L1-like esterase
MPTLHVVGDSISQQYGPHLDRFLRGIIVYSRKEEMPGDPAEANGSNGGDSSLVLRYLLACQQRAYHWDYLLLNCGLHDLRTKPATGAKQQPLDAYEHNLRQIALLAQSLANHVVWVRTTPVVDAIHNTSPTQEFHRFATDVETYNAVADSIMSEHGVPIIDLFDFTRRLGEDAYADHVHYVENVQREQAAFIAGYLLALIS